MREPAHRPGARSLHIGSLRVRIPGRSTADGRRFAGELANALRADATALLDGTRGGTGLGELRLSVKAPERGGVAPSVGAAITSALSRAGAGTHRRR
jgi:hypothetical protein